MTMTKKQKDAIKQLELAFRKCSNARLIFYGLNAELYCCDSRVEKTASTHGGFPGFIEAINDKDIEAIAINTSRSYLESGGL
jgi:hypothetical protein